MIILHSSAMTSNQINHLTLMIMFLDAIFQYLGFKGSGANTRQVSHCPVSGYKSFIPFPGFRKSSGYQYSITQLINNLKLSIPGEGVLLFALWLTKLNEHKTKWSKLDLKYAVLIWQLRVDLLIETRSVTQLNTLQYQNKPTEETMKKRWN